VGGIGEGIERECGLTAVFSSDKDDKDDSSSSDDTKTTEKEEDDDASKNSGVRLGGSFGALAIALTVMGAMSF
jgi:hypothetical protein